MSDNTPNNPGENPRPAENGSSDDRGSGDGFGQNVGGGFEHNNGRGFGDSAGQGAPHNSGRGFANNTGDLGARLNTIAGKLRYLRRSRNDKVFGGVAGGIAEVLGVETVVVRIAIVVLSVMTGVGFFAYLIAWALIAKAPEGRSFASGSTHRDSNNRVGQSSHQSFHDVDAQGGFQGNPKKMESRQLMAVAIVSIGVLSLFNRLGINLNGDVLWPLALIGIGSAVLFSKSSKGHGEPPDSSDGVSRGGGGPGGGWNDGRDVPGAGFGGGLGSGAGSGGGE